MAEPFTRFQVMLRQRILYSDHMFLDTFTKYDKLSRLAMDKAERLFLPVGPV
jgi:hypothetical protein